MKSEENILLGSSKDSWIWSFSSMSTSQWWLSGHHWPGKISQNTPIPKVWLNCINKHRAPQEHITIYNYTTICPGSLRKDTRASHYSKDSGGVSVPLQTDKPALILWIHNWDFFLRIDGMSELELQDRHQKRAACFLRWVQPVPVDSFT